MRQIGYDGNAKYGTNTQVAKDKCKSLLEKYLVGHKISKFTDFNFQQFGNFGGRKFVIV